MSAIETTAFRPDSATFFQRAMVLATTTLTTMLVGMTMLVTSVIMPQLQGSLSATQDQVAWVITFNIIAIAVVTPMTGWFANRFGRRNVMVFSTLGFVVATVLCGGDRHPGTATEQHYLDLEREAFLSLLGTKKTQERVAHMLKEGKPLRN